MLRSAFTKKELNIGKYLHEKAINELNENGFENFNSIITMLKQSSCLDYHQSTYFLSIIYSYGIKIQPNKTKVSNY